MIHPLVSRHRPRIDIVSKNSTVSEEVLAVAVVPAPVVVRIRERGIDQEGRVDKGGRQTLPRGPRRGHPRLACGRAPLRGGQPLYGLAAALARLASRLRPAADPSLHGLLCPSELEIEAPDFELLVRVRRPLDVLLEAIVLVRLDDGQPRKVLEEDPGHLTVRVAAELLVDGEARGIAQLVELGVAPVVVGAPGAE